MSRERTKFCSSGLVRNGKEEGCATPATGFGCARDFPSVTMMLCSFERESWNGWENFPAFCFLLRQPAKTVFANRL